MARTKITEFRRRIVLERDGHKCLRCGWRPGDPVTRISRRTGMPVYRILEMDHVIPLALGGTNAVENLQTLCSSCNASKGVRVDS